MRSYCSMTARYFCIQISVTVECVFENVRPFINMCQFDLPLGATFGTGITAIKLTALGRPQLLVSTANKKNCEKSFKSILNLTENLFCSC